MLKTTLKAILLLTLSTLLVVGVVGCDGDDGGITDSGGDNNHDTGGGGGGNDDDNGSGGGGNDNDDTGPSYATGRKAISDITGCPTWVNNGGDREFDGNPTDVFFSAQLQTSYSKKQIYLRIIFWAKEQVPDFTYAYYDKTFEVYTAPYSWTIDAILSDQSSVASYREDDHAYDYPAISGGLVRTLATKGDTKGNDVGNCTYDDSHFIASFNELVVRLVRP